MQGRLTPPIEDRFQCFPRERWMEEFHFAAEAGLDCIEWIYDLYGSDVNPVATDDGVNEMRRLADVEGVHILSLCADYFMDKPLVRVTKTELKERLNSLVWLVKRCELVGINRIVLPFIDASRIDTDQEMESVCDLLNRTMDKIEQIQVEIHLETSLSPKQFSDLLSNIPHPLLKVNYDSGNSSSLGYNPKDEFAAYGARIGSVHIKDRIKGGGTVPLGTGDADFVLLANCLKSFKYDGDFILQVARDSVGAEISWAAQNREFVENLIDGYQ
jgi:hexulose-6-phosphate isomerase